MSNMSDLLSVGAMTLTMTGSPIFYAASCLVRETPSPYASLAAARSS